MTDDSLEAQIETLLGQLTLKEKCALLSGLDTWRTVPIPRLGIESLAMTDGPHGVRADKDRQPYAPATSFPTGVSMAASWNPELIRRVGEALGEETRALGCDVLLGPCVNIVRHPLAGRNFESYAEDPCLAGRIGVAFVDGVQSKGVGASLKHYALNNQETERLRGSSEVDERTMREIYLAQFEMIVNQADPWTVMCAYNRINGEYASQHETLMRRILKEEWGYAGAVISDWGAVHATVGPLQGGLDLEMPGPAKWFGNLLAEAVNSWQLEPAVIDEAVRRMLRLLQRCGKLPGASRPPEGKLNTPDHQALARELAGESLALLKNEDGLLPLDAGKLRKIAVIGPMAEVAAIGGGGSSYLEPPYAITPIQGLQEMLGEQVELQVLPGCDNLARLPVISPKLLTPSRGEGPGLFGEYFASANFTGQPRLERVDANFDFWALSFGPQVPTPRPFSVRWSGVLTPQRTGRHTFGLNNSGSCRIIIDGVLLLENSNTHNSMLDALPYATAAIELETGKPVDIRIEYNAPAWLDDCPLSVLFAYTPALDQDTDLPAAVAAAQAADAALVFVGWPQGHESEGFDRQSIHLTGRQDELIARLAAVNPRTVVVVYAGSPVAMPWIDEVAAVVQAWYPGQEGGRAVAKALFGEINPSGKLPVTFPKRLEDTPAYVNFPGERQVHYGEGIFVGYRGYDQRAIEPLFPFGHGLSYTGFAYSGLQLPDFTAIGEPLTVSLTVTNTGDRDGQEVVQVYVHDEVCSVARPPAELKGFAKINLKSGASQTVSIELDHRAFAFFHPVTRQWTVEPGVFEIRVGSSSRDIRLRGKLNLG